MANTNRAAQNDALRAQSAQVDTSGTSGDNWQEEETDDNAVFTATPVAPQYPTKIPTGEDTEVATENE